MPKYYCDYCDTFLTHDSPSVRKTHNGGRKHKENVRMFYQVCFFYYIYGNLSLITPFLVCYIIYFCIFSGSNYRAVPF
ncbi:hypothetical protein Y032_0172g377 [Ancylostoma ceylanicum]|uniref:Matrin-type domain-containing protein n=1 Tax=Ancylostoma ceylanicum TaxID=53326 RepID=A0A016SVN9_9BILA|nr:hypothetical protein Y032_0172g377 [Ancylostoma ceylanicum]